jgi:probable phosphoglycerate mutase
MNTLWLIRHGETQYGVEGRYCGVSDVPLTARGQAQAAAIARRLAAHPLAALYSSPLQRALQTAAPLAVATGVAPSACPELAEIDLGAWDGLTEAEIAARDPELFARYRVGRDQATPPGGEPLAAFADRVTAAFHALAARHADAEVAVVTHKCVIRVLLCRLLDLPLARYPAIHQAEGAINRILIEPHRIVIAGVNDRCHLQA